MSATQTFLRHQVAGSKVAAGLFRHSIGVFLGCLLAVYALIPFVEMLPEGTYMDAVLLTGLMIAAICAVGGRRRSLIAAAVLASPVLFGCWFQYHRAQNGWYPVFMVAFFVFVMFVIVRFLYFILRAPSVNSEVLWAGVSVYLLFGLLWAAAYALVSRLVPGSFGGLPPGTARLQGFDTLYFSLITLTTVGYGDITPLSRPARMLAMMEALCGSFYMAILVARLVSLHTALAPQPSPPTTDGTKSPPTQ